MSFWLNPNGKICVTAEGKPVLCDTSPCEEAVVTACCTDGLPATLTLSWTSSTGGLGGGGGGSLELTYNGVSTWAFAGVVPGADPLCESTIAFECFGSDPDGFEITALGGGGGGAATVASASCSPYLGTLNQPLDTGCITLNDATVTE
jgi:hypothetical protein